MTAQVGGGSSRSGPGDAVRVVQGAFAVAAVALVALVAYSLQDGGPGIGGIGTGIALGAGAFGVGGLVGMLFGIPRSLQGAPQGEGSGEAGAEGGGQAVARYRANTNLEEISDWLTKIIVGVSLTQLGEIRGRLVELIDAFAPAFAPADSGRAFVAGLLATGTVGGFVAGYLLARLYLPRAFLAADPAVEAARREAQQAAQVAVTAAAQARSVAGDPAADVEAIRLVDQQLFSGVGTPTPGLDELIAAMEKASPSARELVFQRAYDVRTTNWRDQPAKMARSIPVFRALINTEGEEVRHRYHGQLGYALKDQPEPDLAAAIAELTTAIAARDAVDESGWRFYEFNRALARIRAPGPAGAEGQADAAAAQAIVDDLRRASEDEQVASIIDADEEVRAWLAANGLDQASITAPAG